MLYVGNPVDKVEVGGDMYVGNPVDEVKVGGELYVGNPVDKVKVAVGTGPKAWDEVLASALAPGPSLYSKF